MPEDKKALLQKVLDLKLTKSEVEKAIGLPVNSLSAMCGGKKELPGKYVEPLRKYLTDAGLLSLAISTGAIPVIPEDQKPDLDENGLPKSLSLSVNLNSPFSGFPINKPFFKNPDGTKFVPGELNSSVNFSPKSFDSEKVLTSFIDEFPQYKTEDPLKEGITKGETGKTFKVDYSEEKDSPEMIEARRLYKEKQKNFAPGPPEMPITNVIESFLKSEGITPEQLIEGYKSWANRMSGIAQAVKEQEKNPPIITTTNTPQGLSQAALDIRKKKLGY